MKTSELKQLIKEAVRDAIRDEMKDILLEALKTPKQLSAKTTPNHPHLNINHLSLNQHLTLKDDTMKY